MLFIARLLVIYFPLFILMDGCAIAYDTNNKAFYLAKKSSITEIVNSRNLTTEFFQLDSNNNIYILDFANLQEQGYTMNRLALFTEASNAPRDRVVNNAEMAELVMDTGQNGATLYHGHDVRMESLALFFNLVIKHNIGLNLDEEKLKKTLLNNHLLSFKHGLYQAVKNKALISISKLQKDSSADQYDESVTILTRQYVLQHEVSHGEYFTNKEYRKYCYNFWETILTKEQREGIRHYLDSKYYDKNQEDLMINEFQAYLVYTGIHFGDLFDKGKLKNISSDEALKLRKRFISGSTSSLPVIYTDADLK